MTKAFRGERLHIAVLGRCNTGKSTVLNLIAGQKAAIVSPQAGTTGDPVGLGFELLPFGPVTLYDTAGLDEASELGALRRQAGRKVLARADIALVVTDESGFGPWEHELLEALRALETPTLVLFNKADLGPASARDKTWCEEHQLPFLALAADRTADPAPLREALLRLMPEKDDPTPLIRDLLLPGGTVLCVTPIDASAPKGRLIVPQVQVLRELVEFHHPALLTQHTELPRVLHLLRRPPDLVVTDSQVVKEVAAALPPEVPLTTFSLLFARLKGDFSLLLQGTRSIDTLHPGAAVLIAEACSHHPQDDDIARVKLPKLFQQHCGHALDFSICSGADFPDDLGRYSLVLHCGGCMLNPREMRRRLRLCAASGVPVSNFGMAISLMQGVLDRVTAPLTATTQR